MKTHVIETTCSICGGEGMATPRTAASEWTAGNEIVHTDPNICRRILEQKRIQAEKESEDLAAQQRAKFDADDEYMFEQMEIASE